MSAPVFAASQECLLAALETVRDPELDEPITSLGFVASCAVSAAGDAQVRLRLPTYFCAPNFAYLMVADAYDVVSALPGVRRVEVVLGSWDPAVRHDPLWTWPAGLRFSRFFSRVK